MSKPTLYMTVGLPRSGKSTWAARQGPPVVNPDSIRLAMHGQVFCQSAEKLVWAHADLTVRSLFLAGHNAVILDATNVSYDRRAEWDSPNWDRACVVFVVDADECARRATVTGRSDLVPVIRRMADKYDPPGSFSPGETSLDPFTGRFVLDRQGGWNRVW